MQDAHHQSGRRRALPALAVLLAMLGGCAGAPPADGPAIEPISVNAARRQPAITVVPPEPAVTPPSIEPPPPPPRVAVVLSSRSAAFEDIALELGDHFDTLSIYDLSDKSQPPVRAFSLINDSPTDIVVAVGLRAARSAIAMSSVPVVFSQVFNYQDYDLIRDNSRGVSATAPMDAQLAAWKRAEPSLSSVGLIVGPGHETLIEEAEIAAQQSGVVLMVSTAASDQEALFVFKRMIHNIDGFWLVPDNRVLSPRVLAEIVDRSKSRGVSVLVPSPKMLAIGGSISVSTVAADIAARIDDVIDAIARGDIERVPAMTPLTEIRVEINEAATVTRTVVGYTNSERDR